MELKTKTLEPGYGRNGKNFGEIRKIISRDKMNLKVCELVGLNAKLGLLDDDELRFMSINEGLTKENIGKIVKIIYNKFNGRDKTIELMREENGSESLVRISVYVDMDEEKITDGRIVFSKDDEIPFRLYEIENLMVGRKFSGILKKNLIIIMMSLLKNKGYCNEDVAMFLQGYLRAVNELK